MRTFRVWCVVLCGVGLALESQQLGCGSAGSGAVGDATNAPATAPVAGAADDVDESAPRSQHRAACDAGEADACYALAMHFVQDPTAENLAKAVVLLERACDSGDGPSCSDLGSMYGYGEGVAQDWAKARDFQGKACGAGFATGCRHLAALHASGEGGPQDYSKAAQYDQMACEGGDDEGCVGLGTLFYGGKGVARDHAKAAAIYRPVCNRGNGLACAGLGDLHRHGLGVEQDIAKARVLYMKACDGDVAFACRNLGVIYGNGTSVEQDPTKAASLFKRACSSDDGMGCHHLGIAYRKGLGVVRDVVKAQQLYQKACDLGLSQGCEQATEINRSPDAGGELAEHGLEQLMAGGFPPGSGPIGNVRLKRATVRGDGVSKVDLRRVILRSSRAFRDCYENGLRSQPSMAGEVRLLVAISGVSATVVSVTQSALGNATVEGCVAAKLRTVDFPTPRGSKTVVADVVLHFKRVR